MSRDQRAQDNWALLHARSLALKHRVGLSVIFCLVPTFHEATIRQYGFMLKGLAEVEAELRGLGIPFHCLQGDPVQSLPSFVSEHDACALVADFSPLRVGLAWKKGVADKLPEHVPLYEVDTHNVVPVWVASDKQEVGARTIRKKITEKLPTWLTDIPPLEALPADDLPEKATTLRHSSASLLAACSAPTDWDGVRASLRIDRSVPEIDWCKPGYSAGMANARAFCDARLKLFADQRNDPNVHALSDLSPYYHFGQISPQRVALLVKEKSKSQPNGTAAFLEESIVRRELADNFCFYQPNYDNLDGAAGWARDSLELHAKDKVRPARDPTRARRVAARPAMRHARVRDRDDAASHTRACPAPRAYAQREHIYSLEQLEGAGSHEDIWNAAQRQMVHTGKMHGFMRMYWAKKILEWSPDPAEALRRAIYLNDKYSIDGRDPNGYVGCAWSVMGTHDMGWAERAVFGKIRYMNYAGCKRKFDLKTYVAKWGGGPIKGPIKPGGGGGSSSSAGGSALAKSFAKGAASPAAKPAAAKPAAKPAVAGSSSGSASSSAGAGKKKAPPPEIQQLAKKYKIQVSDDPLF